MKRRYEERSSNVKNTEQDASEAEGHKRKEPSIRPGSNELMMSKDQQENENSSIYYSFSSSFYSSTSVPKTDNKGCIYYIQVKTIKGVAVAWATETGMEPIQRAPLMYELNPFEEGAVGSPHQPLPSEALAEMAKSMNDVSEDYKEEEVPGPSRLTDERRWRKIPDWMISTDNGYRCVACCRVFLTLEALKKHAKSGPKEGFSCHIFNKKIRERQRASQNLPLVKDQHLTQSHKDQRKTREDHGKGKSRRPHTSPGTRRMKYGRDKDME